MNDFIMGLGIVMTNIFVMYLLHLVGWLDGYLCFGCILLGGYGLVRLVKYISTGEYSHGYTTRIFKWEMGIIVIGLLLLSGLLYTYKLFF